MAVPAKPLVVLTSTPGQGHTNPMKTVAKALLLDGYEVKAVCSSHYRSAFEGLGCSYVAIQGYGDYWDGDRDVKFAERASIPVGLGQVSWTIEHSFIRVIPDQLAAVQKAINIFKEQYPGRPVILLNEATFLGSLPLMKDAPGVKPDGIIGIGINPVSLTSKDTAPNGPGLPPPTSAAEIAKYDEIRKQIYSIFAKPEAVMIQIMKDLGAKIDDSPCWDAPYLWPDRFLQMCPASTQYPRSDAPKTMRYTGGLPKLPKQTGGSLPEKPTWWNEVLDNPTKKDIVFVCQGTVNFDYNDLVIPTIEAMKDRPNTLVIVVLGMRGGTLDSSIPIPENVRVADYIPFDDILPLCSIFVGNGGYGGVQHSISHGTPMVLAGETEDKTEMCAISEWIGVALNLKTGKPTIEALRAGIDKVLSEPKYKEACQKIQAEMETADPIGVVAETMDELLAGFKA